MALTKSRLEFTSIPNTSDTLVLGFDFTGVTEYITLNFNTVYATTGGDIPDDLERLSEKVSDYINNNYNSIVYVSYENGIVYINTIENCTDTYVDSSALTVNYKFIFIGNNYVKYFFEFKDFVNVDHRVEIYLLDYIEEAIEIVGGVSMSKSETDDTLEAIRGTGLSLDLEANPDLTFDDIYTSDERIYSVKYFRDGVNVFYGWISPSDIYESYVDNVWYITIECQDGLGYLENLSYVDNDTGLPFTGKQSGLEIIVNCLKRTNLQQNINTSINIHYENDVFEQNVLAFAKFNTERFIKEDEDTYMDCEEVLRSVLEIFGACITQHNGEWYIYKPNELFDNETITFYAHDSNGNTLPDVTLTTTQLIGSDLDGFYPHYVNNNQQVSTENAIGAFSVNYKYGVVNDIFENKTFEWEGSTGLETINEWIINDRSYINFENGSFGYNITLDVIDSDNENDLELIMTSNSFSVSEGNVFDFEFLSDKNPRFAEKATSYIRFILTDGTNTYYLTNGGLWVDDPTYVIIEYIFKQKDNLYITTEGAPINGNAYVEIYTPLCTEDFFTVYIELKSFNIIPVESRQGEVYSFQVKNNPSTKIKEVQEVYNGDEPTDVFIGTIYEINETTPTELWYRDENPTRLVPLLRIMGEERMKMYAKPLRIFSGDVYGYIPFLSVIHLDGFDNIKFMCIAYNYDAFNNITTLKLKQILNDPIGDANFSGLKYELNYDYGNVVNPTIIG